MSSRVRRDAGVGDLLEVAASLRVGEDDGARRGAVEASVLLEDRVAEPVRDQQRPSEPARLPRPAGSASITTAPSSEKRCATVDLPDPRCRRGRRAAWVATVAALVPAAGVRRRQAESVGRSPAGGETLLSRTTSVVGGTPCRARFGAVPTGRREGCGYSPALSREVLQLRSA